MTSKDFEIQYGVKLLPYSTESTQLGELMYEKGLFSRTLEYANETILDIIDIKAPEREKIENELKGIPVSNAQFPDINVNHSFNGSEGLKIPFINLDLSDVLDHSSNMSFTLSNVTSKRLFGNLEFNLRNLTDKIPRGKLQHKLLITQLFYASSVTLKTSKNITENIDASLDKSHIKGIKLNSDNSGKGTSNYTFSGTDKCPFAAQLIKLILF